MARKAQGQRPDRGASQTTQVHVLGDAADHREAAACIAAAARGRLSSGWDLTEDEELGPVTEDGLSDSWGLGPATEGGLSNGFWLDTKDWGLVPDPARSLTLSIGWGLESVLSGGLSGSGGL